jgi:hypothetical protein
MFDRSLIKTIKPISSKQKYALCRLAAILISVATVGRTGVEVLPDWRNPAQGFEAYWIAKALAAGNGTVSHPSTDGFSIPLMMSFHPTAWADPFYTIILAGIIRLFGNYHELAALIFNLVLLLAIFWLTYRLGERWISPSAGVLSVLTLALIRDFPLTAGFMNNTVLACVMVLLSALELTRFLEGPSNHRAGALGLVLGMTALSCPGAQLFIPVAAIAVACLGWKKLGPTVPQAILLFVVSVITILPWTTRNYLVFREYIPLRTGVGQITFVSVVATAGTVAPDTLRSHVKPPWNAGSPRRAVIQSIEIGKTSISKGIELIRFQLEYAKDVGPPSYMAMDEFQRDAWFLNEAKDFILKYPVTCAKLAAAKLEVFIRTPHVFYGVGAVLASGVCLLAALGGVLATSTPVVWILALWVGSYVGPFLIITPFFYRYRAPVEPLLVVLAAFAIWKMFEIGNRRLRIGGG